MQLDNQVSCPNLELNVVLASQQLGSRSFNTVSIIEKWQNLIPKVMEATIPASRTLEKRDWNSSLQRFDLLNFPYKFLVDHGPT